MEPLCVLVGPTGSGKSAAAIPVARELGAEIVSLDSMLLYRGMDIGTDKPRDRGGVPHHLIDCLDPKDPFHLADYLRSAEDAIEGIRGRGRRVLVVGGTGLYLIGLLKGVFEGPPPDPALRARIEALPPEALLRRLAEVDPATFRKLHPHDRRRQRRAVEVYEQTGTPLSALQTQFKGPDRHAVVIAGIQMPREVLRERIRARIDAMFAKGLLEEVRGLEFGPTAAQAVGYKEVLGHLRGAIGLEEARRLVERNTLRLVRRQGTWFRRFDVTWVDGLREDLVPRLLDVYRGRTTE